MTTLKAALAYAARGWLVVPLHTPKQGVCSCRKENCSSPGKHPRTEHGLKDGSIDPKQIALWWKKWPDANLGILTGQESGLLVLDVDGEDGKAALQTLTEEHGALPKTLCVKTGRTGADGKRNGFHYYFRAPGGAEIRNSAGVLGKGLDIRADGGYVVAPPSLHLSGLLYEWLAPEPPLADPPLADAPSWMLAKLAEVKPALEVSRGQGETIAEGGRNAALASLAGSMRRRGMTPEAIEAALLKDNEARCKPPLPANEVREIARGMTRYKPGAQAFKPLRRPDLVCLSDVQAQLVSWLWEPYIPQGMLTVLSGDPGVGKTFIALAIAASLTRGNRPGSNLQLAPENVLYLTLENSPAHVLRPRFDAQHGDATRLYVMRGTVIQDGETEKQGTVSLADTDDIESAIKTTQARLVVIDPLQSFFGAGVDIHRSNETRPILDGLSKMAEKYNCAMLIVRHLSKGQSGRAIHRGLGSIDITGAARSEIVAAPHPSDSSRRVMAHAKSNLGKYGDSLEFEISSDGQFHWLGKSELTANELLAPEVASEDRSALDEAVDFLREVLGGGPQPTNEVKAKASERGISPATLRRAEGRLKLIKAPDGFGQGWKLSLPSVAQESPELFNTEP
jgi:KaiC/GvpD/RAD55 family RecA-like ATPase